uniref:hypothetical protein n=1 Tax=Nocardia abscessus TaxID=120957 RepID=UPI00245790FA
MPTTRSADLVPTTEHIVRHLLDIIPRRHVTSGNLLREEIRATVANCLDLVAGRRAPPPPPPPAPLHFKDRDFAMLPASP